MKYLPHAIYKLFESMPNPWETNKKVNVVYHITGALSIINDTPKMNEIIYRTLWSIVWHLLKENKIKSEY